MPIQLGSPGVYISEIVSGTPTITGVATSITAFIGAAPRGPINQPTTVFTPGDYSRIFGGIAASSTMSNAVSDFFANGGGQAVIVRVTSGSSPATLSLPTSGTNPLDLVAANDGLWGNGLTATVDDNTATVNGVSDPKLFNLTIVDAAGTTEVYRNVAMDSTYARYLPAILAQSSQLALVDSTKPLATDPPKAVASSAFAGGADGTAPTPVNLTGDPVKKTGMYALDSVELFNLLCMPPPADDGTQGYATTLWTMYMAAMDYCASNRAFLIVDPPAAWSANPATAAATVQTAIAAATLPYPGSQFAALYFPRIIEADPLHPGASNTYAPSGTVAGIMARTDATRGVWKAPAGIDAVLNTAQGLEVVLTDADNGTLNPIGVNCLRSFPIIGKVVWGSRTLRGADVFSDEYKYVPVRRLALFLETSLYQGTQWAVFEPNDEPLWLEIQRSIGAFMQSLFVQGAFQGTTPDQAYFVKCDSETTTQTDVNLGVVNILVGFAPLNPAEFVVISIQQMAGQAQT
jgi:phage tail sheath protein FI